MRHNKFVATNENKSNKTNEQLAWITHANFELQQLNALWQPTTNKAGKHQIEIAHTIQQQQRRVAFAFVFGERCAGEFRWGVCKRCIDNRQQLQQQQQIAVAVALEVTAALCRHQLHATCNNSTNIAYWPVEWPKCKRI